MNKSLLALIGLGVFVLISIVGTSNTSGISKYIWLEERPFNVLYTEDEQIGISDVSQQELQKAAHQIEKEGPSYLERITQEQQYQRFPEYLPTKIYSLNQQDYKTHVQEINYQLDKEIKSFYLRIIETKSGSQIVTKEPGTPGPNLITSKDGSYSVFYDGSIVYGLDTSSLEVQLITPEQIDGYNLTELWEQLQEIDSNMFFYWAHGPSVSSDGRFVVYSSQKRQVAEAIRYAELAYLRGSDIWIYDRETEQRRLLYENGGVVRGWIDETTLVTQTDGPLTIVSISEGILYEIPDTEIGKASYLASNRNSIIYVEGRGNIVLVNTTTYDKKILTANGDVAVRPDLTFSPNGRYLPLFEYVGDEYTQTVTVVDLAEFAIIHSIEIPDQYSFRGFGGWLDNENLIVNVITHGATDAITEKSLIIPIKEGVNY